MEITKHDPGTIFDKIGSLCCERFVFVLWQGLEMEMEMEITEHGPGTKFVKMGLQYTTLRLLKNNI